MDTNVTQKESTESSSTDDNTINVDLESKAIYDILKAKGITHFHHANTVTTSKSFITEQALLSRQRMESGGMLLTSQKSDAVDKILGINNYLFLDGVDFADFFSQSTPNNYGPVLFKFPIEILLHPNIPTVRISKFNPIYWKNTTPLEIRYFTNTEDFNERYLKGDKGSDAGKCFIITTLDGKLPFNLGLDEIKLDDPRVKNSYGEDAFTLISSYLFDDNDFLFERTFGNVKRTKRIKFFKYSYGKDFIRFFKRDYTE